MLSRVAAPIAGDALAVVRDHIREIDPTFELSDKFQTLATVAEVNIYPWKGGPFDFDDLVIERGGEESNEEGEGSDEKGATEVMEEGAPRGSSGRGCNQGMIKMQPMVMHRQFKMYTMYE